jgi:hypothetical protein
MTETVLLIVVLIALAEVIKYIKKIIARQFSRQRTIIFVSIC